jgi:glycine/D-amino acid oxidase-like deaminating enzyme
VLDDTDRGVVTMRVIVIGGGIIGATLTYRLTQAGAGVTLLEARQLGGGTSTTSFAWLNANDKPPFPYHQLNVDGMAEWQTLARELGHAPWLHRSGHVEWDQQADGPTRLREKVTRLRAWGYPAELLPVRELAGLEPDLVAPPELEEFALYPTEGYLDPLPAIGTLFRAARARGAEIRTNCAVTGFRREGERVVGVTTATGERLYADIVVSCVGRWSAEVARLAGIDLPMAPTVGLTALSAPSAAGLRAVFHSHQIALRPDGAGRIMLHHGDFDDLVTLDTPVEPVPALAADLLARAAAVLPSLAGMRVEAVRIAHRSIPGDGYTTIGPLTAAPGLYLIATHSAITMGALLGRLATREILADTPDPRLATFRPERLVRQTTPVGA